MTAARKAAEKWLKEGFEEARHKGRQEGTAQSLLLIYKNRLGRVPARIRAGVLAISDEARLQSSFPLFLSGDAGQIAGALQR